MRPTMIALGSLALGACALQPVYVRPTASVPAAWPTGSAYATGSTPMSISLTYREVFLDPRLQALVERALASNRDLRVATANIAAARARYRIQRAGLFPHLNAEAGLQSAGDGPEGSSRGYSVGLASTGFELDLFGRMGALTAAAQERYLASEAGARAVRITLIADLAEAWTTHAVDGALLSIAEETARSAEASVRLTQARLEAGIAPRSDLRQAETVLATARADIAALQTQVAQDYNAIALLVGEQPPEDLLAGGLVAIDAAFASPPSGLSSDILLARPDILQAEYELRAATIDIGVARAALFPRLTLTGAAGYASEALSSLIAGDALSWSSGATLGLPLFQGGAGRAGVDHATAQREVALATYERAVQSAFRDTADALARQGTIAREVEARRAGLAAAQDVYDLADTRYRAGIDGYLASLDAQRSLYAARRTDANARLALAISRVALYRALTAEPLEDYSATNGSR